MNRTLRKFSVMILSGVLLAACNDDDSKDASPAIEPEFPTEYSGNTVEQNKSQLQDNSIQLVNKMNTLKSSTGIQTSIAFTGHLDGAKLPDNMGGRVANNRAISLLQVLASLGNGRTGNVAEAMRAEAEDFASIEELFNGFAGVYTYNKGRDTWEYTKTGSKIVFKFPSTKTGTANNAEYSVYDYKGVKVSSPIGGDDYKGDYPAGLKADLTVDGAKKMEYSFSASYANNGTPTAVSTSIKIDSYTFLYEITNSTTEAKMDYSLSESGKVLFALGARGKGSFTADNIVENGGDALADASAYFQIMNVKFSGQTNAKALQAAVKAAKTEAEVVKAYNDNYKLIVFYADSKKKIADSEFYVTTSSYSYEWCNWEDLNGNGWYDEGEDVCEIITETNEHAEIRMVFQDGSKSDLKTYTDTGFENLSKELEKFVNSL